MFSLPGGHTEHQGMIEDVSYLSDKKNIDSVCRGDDSLHSYSGLAGRDRNQLTLSQPLGNTQRPIPYIQTACCCNHGEIGETFSWRGFIYHTVSLLQRQLPGARSLAFAPDLSIAPIAPTYTLSAHLCTAMYTSYKALQCRSTQTRSSTAMASHQPTSFDDCYGSLLEENNGNTSSTSVKASSKLKDNNNASTRKG